MVKEHPTVRKLLDRPGVYFFVGKHKEVLYVGKATSLRDRVRSYFGKDLATTRGEHMVRMVGDALRVECRETDSVLEALILEAKLIKELKPPYNTRDKDDKSWHYLVITTQELYPRLLTVRGKELQSVLADHTGVRVDGTPTRKSVTNTRSIATQHTMVGKSLPVYGPFVHAGQFKEALKIIRHIFPYYDTAYPVEQLREKNDRKLRFNESIGMCPRGDIKPAEYRRTIRHIRLFFEGKKKRLLTDLEHAMYGAAKRQDFEEAQEYKRQLFALRHIDDISLIRRNEHAGVGGSFRVEGYDVAHLQGAHMVGVMAVIVGNEVLHSEYRTFTIRSVHASNDTAALREVLSRRLAHPEWQYPRLIVVDGGRAQLNAARDVLHRAGVEVPVVAVTKDEHHRPKAIIGDRTCRTEHAKSILLANAEAHRFSLTRHRRLLRKRSVSTI